MRALIATLLIVGLGLSMPERASAQTFDDVPTDFFAFEFIETLAATGITSGCDPVNFCPNDSITRAQMAVFLLRALNGSDYMPPAASGAFNDVTLEYWAVAWAEQLVAAGISSGCGDGNFCPDDPVTRAQMAVFLVRAFNLEAPPLSIVPWLTPLLLDGS